MTRTPKAVAAAVALALAGTLLIAGYVRSASASTNGELVPVLVAKGPIAAGTSVGSLKDQVTTQRVPKAALAEGAVANLTDLANKVAAIDLVGGEQLTRNRFVASDQLRHAVPPPGTSEVTINLEPARAIGGTVRPGDTVDVYASLDNPSPSTALLLSKVLVTRVQSSAAMPKSEDGAVQGAPSGSMLVTLAVDQPSTAKLLYAAEHGRLWLSAVTQ